MWRRLYIPYLQHALRVSVCLWRRLYILCVSVSRRRLYILCLWRRLYIHWGLDVSLLVATPRVHVCLCAGVACGDVCVACGDVCVACGDVCVACGDGDVKHKHAFFYSNSCVACGDSCQIQTETRGRICEYKQTARTCAASRVRVSTVATPATCTRKREQQVEGFGAATVTVCLYLGNLYWRLWRSCVATVNVRTQEAIELLRALAQLRCAE